MVYRGLAGFGYHEQRVPGVPLAGCVLRPGCAINCEPPIPSRSLALFLSLSRRQSPSSSLSISPILRPSRPRGCEPRGTGRTVYCCRFTRHAYLTPAFLFPPLRRPPSNFVSLSRATLRTASGVSAFSSEPFSLSPPHGPASIRRPPRPTFRPIYRALISALSDHAAPRTQLHRRTRLTSMADC